MMVHGAFVGHDGKAKAMAVYKQKNSKRWWFKLSWNGQLIRESAKQTNRRRAEQIEAARKTQLAKGEVGIHEKKPVPTLKDFAPRFERAIDTLNAEKPATVAFYKEKLQGLLSYGPIATASLDAIDEAMVEAYKEHGSTVVSRYNKPFSPASIDRETGCAPAATTTGP
jgi:hypothetical protein